MRFFDGRIPPTSYLEQHCHPDGNRNRDQRGLSCGHGVFKKVMTRNVKPKAQEEDNVQT